MDKRAYDVIRNGSTYGKNALTKVQFYYKISSLKGSSYYTRSTYPIKSILSGLVAIW